MRFTEENIKNFIITKAGKFRNILTGRYLFYHYACIVCGYPYLNYRNNSNFCSKGCAVTGENNPMYGLTPEQTPGYGKIGKLNPMFGKGYLIAGERHQYHNVTGYKHPRYGRQLTEQAKQRISYKAQERLSDPTRHPMWKGGISCEPYCTQWSDKEYKNWLKHERDDGKCQNPQCNGKSNRLVLHHINYDKKDCRPSNLITLCNSCNCKANKDREWHESWYTILMMKMETIKSWRN